MQKWMTPRRLMAVSIGVALLTISLKAGAWWVTGSVGLLSDALESVVNLVGATFGLWMVTVAAWPADDNHQFGHDKAEYFSSGFEGMLIIVVAVIIIWTAVPRFWQPHPLHDVGWGVVLSIISSMLNGVLAWVMLRASRRHRSVALEGDARHLLTDVWTSAGVVIGLGLVAVTGWLWLDPLVAIGVALNIVREGWRLLWKSVEGLMDVAVDEETQASINVVLARFEKVHGQRHVVVFDHVMTRKAGQRRFVDLHMHLPQNWTLMRAAELRRQVEHALLEAVPGLHATIQVLPDGVEPIFTSVADAPAAAPSPPENHD